MFDFYEWRKIKTVLYSRVSLVILGIVVLLLLNSVWNVYFKERETRLARKKLESQLNELKDREALLRAEIERLSTERGIEEEVRSKFDVGREGEEVMVIVDPKEKVGEETTQVKKGFWARLFDIF